MQAETALNNVTDWTAVFCQLASLHLTDPLFHASNFAKLPTKLIADMLTHGHEDMQRRANATSVSTAKLAVVVSSALGAKGPQLKIDQFLPYDLSKGGSALEASTREALQWALKNEKLPAAIVGMIGAELG